MTDLINLQFFYQYFDELSQPISLMTWMHIKLNKYDEIIRLKKYSPTQRLVSTKKNLDYFRRGITLQMDEDNNEMYDAR